MRGDWRIGLVQVVVDFGIAGERVRLGAIGEIIDVFRADNVNEFQRGLDVAGGLALCLTLSWLGGLGGWRGGC